MKKIYLFLLFAVLITFSSHSQYYLNYSAIFNGSSGYVAVPSSNEILLPCTTGKITIEAWINPASVSNYPTICGKNYLTSFWFGFNSSGNLRFYPQGGAGAFMDGNTTIPVNKWTHVAATFNGDTARIYINGVLDKESVTFSGAIGNNTDSLFIGCDRNGTTPAYFYNGEIDNLRLWSEARMVQQINETMFMPLQLGGNSVFKGSYKGLFASYNFDGGCWDWSGNFDNGTAHNISYKLNGSDPLTYCDFNNNLILDGKSYCCARNFPDFNATTAITVEAWVCRGVSSTYPAAMNIVNKSGGTSSINYALDYLTDSSSLNFYAFNTTVGMLFLIKGYNQLTDFRWHHVAAVYNSADGKAVLYVDGDSVAGKIFPAKPVIVNDADSLFIGSSGIIGQSVYKFIGQIDEVRIWKDLARTQAEIKKDMFCNYANSGGFIKHCEFSFNEYSNWMKVSNSGIAAILDLKGNARFSSQLKQDNLYLSSPVLFNADDSIPEFGKSLKPWLIGKTGVFSDSFYVSQTGNITNLKLYVLINTNLLANLKLELVGPTGLRVAVFNVPAFSWVNSNDMMTIFDMNALNMIGESVLPPFSPRIQPDNTLSVFNNTRLDGWWKLVATHGGSVTYCWVNRWGIIPTWGPATGISEQADHSFKLYQNIPNPVNNNTLIKYSLPNKSDVKITIFNELGKIISTPVNKELNPGEYQIEFNTTNLPAGIYFYRMQADNFSDLKRMLIVK